MLANDNYNGQAVYNGQAGTMMALGTLNPAPAAMSSVIQQQPHHQQTMLAMGSNTLMPYHKRAQAAAFATQSATLLRSSNHSYNGAFQVSTRPKYLYRVYFDF